MNISRKVIKVDIDGRELGMVLDFESAIKYHEYAGESIFSGVTRISEQQDLLSLAYFIASVLRDENDEPIGLDFVKKLDLVNSLEFFMEKLTELMENSVPKEDEKSPKKKKH